MAWIVEEIDTAGRTVYLEQHSTEVDALKCYNVRKNLKNNLMNTISMYPSRRSNNFLVEHRQGMKLLNG